MAKKSEGQSQDQAQGEAEEQIVAAPHPDAANYVLQPTSQPLNIEVVGDLPEGRFMEEVLKGSDEEDSSTPSWEAHPPENQPAYGVKAED